MVKTFREVLRIIKPGETWECTEICNIKEIKCCKNGMIETTYTTFSQSGMFCVDGERLFKLKKDEVEFEDAIKALKEGKIIESCKTFRLYKIDECVNGKIILVKLLNSYVWVDSNIVFKPEEIFNKWHIYDEGEM